MNADEPLLRDTGRGFTVFYRGKNLYSAAEPLAQAARDWLRRSTRPGDAFLRRFIQKLNRFRENLVAVDAWLAHHAPGT